MSEYEPVDFKGVMIDNGSSVMKIGWIGRDYPRFENINIFTYSKLTFFDCRSIFPTEFGVPKKSIKNHGQFIVDIIYDDSLVFNKEIGEELRNRRDYFVGEFAQNEREKLKPLSYPLRDVPIDWESLSLTYEHAFEYEMAFTQTGGFEEKDVICSSFNRMDDRSLEKMCSIMFENHKTSNFCMADGSTFSIMESGRASGTILDSGGGLTRSICVYELLPISHTLVKMDENPLERDDDSKKSEKVAGRKITEYLMKIITERGYDIGSQFDMSPSEEREFIRGLKEKLCFVALDYESEYKKSLDDIMLNINGPFEPFDLEEDYELPDGTTMTIGSERFRAPEILFKPSFVGLMAPSVPEIINESIKRCDGEFKSEAISNIVLSGGSTMFEGIKERIEKEMKLLITDDDDDVLLREKVKVFAPPERRNSVWVGGSVFGSIGQYRKYWISKQMYEEFGSKRLKQHFQMVVFDNEEDYLIQLRRNYSIDVDMNERMLYLQDDDKDGSINMGKKICFLNLEIQVCKIHFLLGFPL